MSSSQARYHPATLQIIALLLPIPALALVFLGHTRRLVADLKEASPSLDIAMAVGVHLAAGTLLVFSLASTLHMMRRTRACTRAHMSIAHTHVHANVHASTLVHGMCMHMNMHMHIRMCTAGADGARHRGARAAVARREVLRRGEAPAGGGGRGGRG